MSMSLQVSTVRSEDVSIDNSGIIDQASPRNSVYLSPRKQPKSSLPALHEQTTGSTHASSGDSVFEDIEETEHVKGSVSNKGRWAYDNSTRHAHNDPTRHTSNTGSHPSRGQPPSKFNHQLSSPRYSGATPELAKSSTPSAPSSKETGSLPPKASFGRQQEPMTLGTPTTPRGKSLSGVRRGSIEESLGIDYARFDEEPEEVAAWVIHAALIGFFSLVCLSLVLAFVVIHSYGFLTLVFLGLLVAFCVGLAIFVDQTVLQKNEKLKPIRNKIAFAVTVAKNAIHEEFNLFKNEWRDYHLLLTNGEDGIDGGNVNTATKKKKKKSIMFKMVKPLLGAKKKLFKRKRKQAKATSQSTEVATA